jgi:dynein heavy chain
VTLSEIKYYSVREHLANLQDISDKASKEWNLEKLMAKMQDEWSDLNFELTTFRDTGIQILKGSNVEEIQLLLDDHTIKAQMVRGNPNVKPMETEAIKWEQLLLHIQECLDVWIKVQAAYLYLEPIFNSEDIVKKLPAEASEFLKVNKLWGELMQALSIDTLVLRLEHIPNLLDNLEHANAALDRIQKSLNDYLETKR